jgi:hypothetical protein
VVFRFLRRGPVVTRGIALGGLVEPKDERREDNFAAIRVAVGDGSDRRPIRMRLDGLYARPRKPRCRLLLRRRVGEVQAELFMSIDRDRFVGPDDFESQCGSRQTEYRAGAAIAILKRRIQRQADEIAVELDGWLELCRAASESDRSDRRQFFGPGGRWLVHGVDVKTSTDVEVKMPTVDLAA